jgi:hypothetical protein
VAGDRHYSEAESFSSVPEQRARRRPIEAQSAAIARAMASIGNDERASSGVMSGHDRKTLSLSGLAERPVSWADLQLFVFDRHVVAGRRLSGRGAGVASDQLFEKK